jgi:hypothetical protein
MVINIVRTIKGGINEFFGKDHKRFAKRPERRS